jgi:hypothetical protein
LFGVGAFESDMEALAALRGTASAYDTASVYEMACSKFTSPWRWALTSILERVLMRAILRTKFGRPEVLVIREILEPEPTATR